MQTEQQIIRIKHLLNNKSLSFIIGVGFSKNMSNKFFDWGDLLKPIITEMYHIDDEKEIEHKIEEIGYLGIAQEYVRRKGFHEAIDVYIEQHTPTISIKENSDEPEYIVTLNNEFIESADVTCHRLLFNLDVKHIYTFNYDNCLDIIGNTGKAQKLLSEIRNLQNKLEFLELNEEKLSGYLYISIEDNMKAVKVNLPTAIQNDNGDYNHFIKTLNCNYPELNLFTDNISHIKDNCHIVQNEIARIKAQILLLQKHRESVYQLISSSEMLSLTDGKRSIFKLHGSIRLDKSAPYGFDGDRHCNYIITSEDYKEYPIKHEPFVNYMKISLLKGAFCIIGFSCDDPNFLSWMSWVKEVVDKNIEIRKELSQKNSARFFYIHSADKPLSEEKRLLLKNHYIECVELFNLFKGDCHKVRIIQFLKQLLPTSLYYPKIKKTWHSINKYISDIQYSKKDWNITKISEDIKFIYCSANVNRIPLQSNSDYHNRNHILQRLQSRFRRKWNAASELELMLAFSALREELLLPCHYFDDEIYNQLIGTCKNSLQSDLKCLLHKEQALTNQKFSDTNDHISPFIQIWKYLYNFDFKSAKYLVDSWKPLKDNPIDEVRKQMFKALFSEDVFEDIRPLTNQDLYYSIQDYLNALELLPLISRNYTFGQDGSMNNAIDFSDEVSQIQTDCPYIKNADYILNRLIESIKENNKAIPFGNKSRSFDFDSDNSKFINSFKVLSILFELCRPLHISNIILFSIEKWNIVCDNLYQDYPYPCLFYSLQYNDEKLTKSVSQKILYCDRLTPYLPNIVKSLFASLGQSECPNFYRTPIMKSLSILLIGLDAKFWNSDFTKFFDKLQPYAENGTRKYDDLNYSHENFYELVTFGLTWTSDKDFKLRVISEILHTHESIDNWKNLLITKALKSLTNEDFVASKYYQDIYQDLLWLCQNGNIPAHIYVILNLITLLDTQTVQQCLERLPESLIKSDCTLIQAIPHYIKQDSNLVSVIKRIVLKSPFLWRNGIEKKGMTIGYSFIDITGISNQIDFTATEMEVLWEKMKVSLYQIKEVCNNQREEESTFFINHFATLLDEMKSFIESNTFKAISPKEYDEIYNEIISLRVSVASNVCHSIYDLLIRDETSDAISMLVDIKPEIRFPKYQGEYILLANKLVLMKSQHLNSCMNHFSWIVDSYSEYIPQDIFKSLLEFILIAYEPYFNGKQNWNLPFAKKEDFESGLIKIYSVFKKWGGINVFWQSYKPRFINH